MTREEASYILRRFYADGYKSNNYNALEQALQLAVMCLENHPHWISVEDDGNPIDTGWYIFTTGKIVDVGYYLGGNEWRDVHPTLWMPLPQPPHHFADVSQKVKKGGEE